MRRNRCGECGGRQRSSVTVNFGEVVGQYGEWSRCDGSTRGVGPWRGCEWRKECKSSVGKTAAVGDQLVRADVLGVEVRAGRIGQRDGWQGVGHIRLERIDRRGGCAVIDFVRPLAKHPGLRDQGAATRQVRSVGRYFGRGGAVAGRIKKNVQRACCDGQAVVAAGNRHGSANGSAWAGSIVVGAQDHVAGGHGRCRAHVHVLPSDGGEIAGGNGACCRQVDIVTRRECEGSRGRGRCRSDIDVAYRVCNQTSVGSGHGRSDVDIAQGGQGQRRGCRPGDCLVDVDIAIDTHRTAAAQNAHIGGGQAGAQRGAGDVAASRNREVFGINQPGAKLPLCRLGRNNCVG